MLRSRSIGSRGATLVAAPALFAACFSPVDEDRCATIAGACPPQIRSVRPDQGPVDGGTAVVIGGGPFTAAARVFFQQPAQADAAEARVTLATADQLTVVTPPGLAGPADVAVTDAWNAAVAPGAFFYGRRPGLDGGPVPGRDAGSDGGTGAGQDAGSGPDAGRDGGAGDAGQDGGSDAGRDGGSDGGRDAGPCTGQLIPAPALLPSARFDSSGVSDGRFAYVLGGQLDIFGGTMTDEILRFDPVSGTGTVLPERLPAGRAQSAAVWTGAHAFLFGGRARGGAYLPDIIRYDPAAGRVDTMRSRLPTARYNMTAVWSGTHAYLFGGVDPSGYQREILRYDPVGDVLDVMPSQLPSGIEAPGAFWRGTDAFVVGGIGPEPGSLTRIVRYSPSTGAVQTLPQTLPYGVWAADTLFDGTVAYLFGGLDGNRRLVSRIMRVNLVDGFADPLCFGLPRAQAGAATAWTGTRGFLFGGVIVGAAGNPMPVPEIFQFTP